MALGVPILKHFRVNDLKKEAFGDSEFKYEIFVSLYWFWLHCIGPKQYS